MTINVLKLHAELLSAGIDINGCDENGIVLDLDNNEIQDRADVAAIVAAHDPAPIEITQQVFELPVVAPNFIVQSPKPKKDPKEAHARAIEISKMDKKSIAEIVVNLIVWAEDLEQRLQKKNI